VARSSAGRAYDVLKRQLLRGTIKPGQRIVVEEVCSRLGVSRTPVREALVALDREGLVQTVPRRGYFAREISFREALDAYQLRMILEPIATALAARRIGQKELDVLRRLIDSSAGGTSDIGTLLEMNRSFHVLIAKSAGNERLARVMADLMDDMERLVYVEFDAQHTPSDWRNEHLSIVDSLESRDPDRAASAARATFIRDSGLLAGRAKAEFETLGLRIATEEMTPEIVGSDGSRSASQERGRPREKKRRSATR
jgi:DNA-binding GntR family transcriptional regulator